MFNKDYEWNHVKDENGCILIDADPRYFLVLLNYLRHGELIVEPNLNYYGVWSLARYFQIRPIIDLLDFEDITKWAINRDSTGSSFAVEDGRFKFCNRAYLISRDQFNPDDGEIKLTGTWCRASHDDFFQVATRCDGLHQGSPYFEIQNGLEFNYCRGTASIVGRGGLVPSGVVKIKKQGEFSFPAGVPVHFEVHDDGTNVSFTLWESITKTSITIETTCTNRSLINYIAIHNREKTGSNHISYLANIRIQRWGRPTPRRSKTKKLMRRMADRVQSFINRFERLERQRSALQPRLCSIIDQAYGPDSVLLHTSKNLQLIRMQDQMTSTSVSCYITLNNLVLQNAKSFASGTFIQSSFTKNAVAPIMDITVTNCTFQNAIAQVEGGAISLTGINTNISSLVVQNCEFYNVSAFGYGSAISASNATVFINGSVFSNSAVGNNVIYTEFCQSTINYSSFSNNNVSGTGGVLITTYGNGTMLINNVKFIDNTFISSYHTNSVFYACDSVLTIEWSEFYNNINGSAINADTGSVVTLSNSIVSGTVGAQYGGAVYSRDGSTVFIDNSLISDNSAVQGGAIYAFGSVVTIANSTFSNNSVCQYDDAIYVSFCNIIVSNTSFVRNADGSAIYCIGDSNIVINGVTSDTTEPLVDCVAKITTCKISGDSAGDFCQIPDDGKKKPNLGLIIGATAGAVAGLAFIVLIIYIVHKRRQNAKKMSGDYYK
eukprot:gene1069-1212_t